MCLAQVDVFSAAQHPSQFSAARQFSAAQHPSAADTAGDSNLDTAIADTGDSNIDTPGDCIADTAGDSNIDTLHHA